MSSKLNTLLYPIILFILLLSVSDIYGIEISKEFEISFDQEITMFLADDNLAVWKNNEMIIYKNNIIIKKIKTLRGKGPGDFAIINALFSTKDSYIFWDRETKRFSYFSKKWNFLKIKKINNFYNRFTVLLKRCKNDYIFQWNKFERIKKSSKITMIAGKINNKGDKSVLYKTEGFTLLADKINLDYSQLISTVSGDTLYIADNREYKIYTIDINNKKPMKKIYFVKNEKKTIWKEEHYQLQYEITKKFSQKRKIIYPKHLPPLFRLISSGNILGVITNREILNKKTVIDFYRSGKYIGKVVIPLIYSQYFVFPGFLYFSSDIILDGENLYSQIYSPEDETHKIIKWKITFN